jgi:DNA-binding PadR family transcriptional regulator
MSDLVGGQSDLLILAVLHGGPAHGYAIIEAIKARSHGRFDLPEGTIYPALHRLEKEGLLVSAWTPGERRPRRTYELSAAGQRALADRREKWSRLAESVNAVIGAPA